VTRVPSLQVELAAALDALIGELRGGAGSAHLAVRPLALGWATVDLDRAARQLVARLPGSGPLDPAPPDALLGARCLLGPLVGLPGAPSDLRLAVLEPSTEGRLAATLARRGEGPAAVWVELDGSVAGPLSRTGAGPFGPERLLLGGPAHGPHLLIVSERTSTIRA